MGEKKQPTQLAFKITILAVVLTTIFAIVASVLDAHDVKMFDTLHQQAMLWMMLSYVVLVVLLRSSRQQPLQPLRIDEQNGVLEISEVSYSHILFLSEPLLHDPKKLAWLRERPTTKRLRVRILIAQSMALDAIFEEVLPLYPNVSFVDVQNCQVPASAWDRLGEAPNVQWICAGNAISKAAAKELQKDYPTLRIWSDPRELVFYDAAALSTARRIPSPENDKIARPPITVPVHAQPLTLRILSESS